MTDTPDSLRHIASPWSYRWPLGFAATLGTWFVGYLTHLPGLSGVVPGPLVFALLLGSVLAAGYAAGRRTGDGLRAGVWVGLTWALLNLLILGAVIGKDFNTIGAIASVPILFVIGGIVGGVGAAIGLRVRTKKGDTETAPQAVWSSLFTRIAAGTTLLLVWAGGLVTGYDEGLSVPDWPQTFTMNMFLYPLARMTGGVYFEHSHRLLGSLVGLTLVITVWYLYGRESRRAVRRWAWLALVFVIGQGILGGLRVTGKFTLSAEGVPQGAYQWLAAFHGVTGQIFFAVVVALAVVSTRAWMHGPASRPAAYANWDRTLTRSLVVLLVLQTIFGAVLRHFDAWLHLHAAWAVVVAIAVGIAGARLLKIGAQGIPMARHAGWTLIILVCLQITLGVIALVVINPELPKALNAWLTTAHQTVGALLLAYSVVAALIVARFFHDAEA